MGAKDNLERDSSHLQLNQTSYLKGISLSKMEMQGIEKRLERNPDLPKWDILIQPSKG